MAHLNIRARNIVLPVYRGPSNKEQCERINRDLLRIWRVVVLPKFRSIGLEPSQFSDSLPIRAPRLIGYQMVVRFAPELNVQEKLTP